ncbi:NmrA family NAD(P)-binding protein [Mucilaginibacter roseus]|uniref:NmrA family NAD(P)-binding protein n=1 Tax=Mucilaginibacter roseus TaxID=1528868 RepID=A0ABS8U792_9SPHI|nr:NmrA family NAD(P)-binding protein [Mucilaginibacter roseus]MCD8742537.1 NmrA family NAD(P)-binding protein [Mucilaginibacter roseus]
MKIIVTGSLGNISKPLAQQLIAAGHQVTVISSNNDKVAEIEQLGAKAAIGSLNDAAFLAQTFAGADSIYGMVPPNYGNNNMRAGMIQVGEAYAEAIKTSGVKKVVFLSSIGAHLDSGTGPIAGLHDVEQLLNKLDSVAIKFLRANYFFTNFYNDIPLVKQAGIIGSNFPAHTRMVMVHPADIADAAAEFLQQPFEGKSVSYVASDDRSAADIAKVLGTAIGKPKLPWVEFTDEQAYEGMIQAGLSPEVAKNYVEMGTAIKTGIMWPDFDQQKPEFYGRKLEDFAKEFAARFNA